MTKVRDRHRVLCVAGARPNMMKVAPLIRALNATDAVECLFVHTGQHFDWTMRDRLIEELELPLPDALLQVGSGSHAVQTAKLLLELEPVFERFKPELVVVVGDVNSTLAAALVATKLRIPVAHVEAGLRSFDRRMPEEINRIVTDQIADLLFATEQDAVDNLVREGIPGKRIRLVGNVMIDTLKAMLPRVRTPEQVLALAGGDARWCERAKSGNYVLVTLHRPSNVDTPQALCSRLEILRSVADRIPIVFPVHPRTRKSIELHGASNFLDRPDILVTDPLSYADMIGLLKGARLVLTDSGGIQDETTGLGVPCLTLRENTERPVTVHLGTNLVVGVDTERILAAADETLRCGGKKGRIPPLWDGRAAERIAAEILEWLAVRRRASR